MSRAFVPVTPKRNRAIEWLDAGAVTCLYLTVHVLRGAFILGGGHLCRLLDRPGNLARRSSWRAR